MSTDLESAIMAVFERSPFGTASTVTLLAHLEARGYDVSEPEVRDCCENLVTDGELRFVREVDGRLTYAPSERTGD